MEAQYIKIKDEDNSLTHYGVKGMKWRKRLKRGLKTIQKPFEHDTTITTYSPDGTTHVHRDNSFTRHTRKGLKKVSNVAKATKKGHDFVRKKVLKGRTNPYIKKKQTDKGKRFINGYRNN